MGRGPDGSPVTPVKIVPSDFHTVAQHFADAQNTLEQVRQDFLNGLDAAHGAAGACDGAHQYQDGWAAALDSIVNDGFHTAFDLLGSIGKGIDVSALNHVTADQDSVPGGGKGGPPWSPLVPAAWPGNTDFVVLTGDSPWWLPGFLDKYIPTADTGRIDDAAAACRKAASGIRELVQNLHTELLSLTGNNTSDDVSALEDFWQRAAGQQSILAELPIVLDQLADSLVSFRAWNTDTQEKIRDKIKSVIDGLGALGVLLAVGSIVTDGGLDALLVGVIEALELFGVDAAGALVAPLAEVAAAAETILVVAGGAIAITQGVGPAMQAAMSSTPNPDIEGADATKISDEVGSHTEPARAPDPNAKPGGRPTNISKNDDAETVRSLGRENESATTLAKAGYDVEQNPATLANGKRPDYRVNGEVFDNYAPITGKARNISDGIAEKIEEQQTERVVLNLKDSPVGLDAMRAQLHDWPIEGLKEVIAIDKLGNILHLYP